MRQKADCLNRFFELYAAYLIQQYGKDHGQDHGEHQFPHGYSKGVHENTSGIGKDKHTPEVIQPHPFGFQEAGNRLEILECHDISEKWYDSIDEQDQKTRKHQQMVLPGLFDGNLTAAAPFSLLFDWLFHRCPLFALIFSKTGRQNTYGRPVPIPLTVQTA